jgi:SAM-dependent methyltransferase
MKQPARALLNRFRHRTGGPDGTNDGGAAPGASDVTEAATEMFPEERWFADHVGAAREVIEFLGGDGLSVEGKLVADIGCGDGIIDLALAHEGHPARLDGFDLNLTDADNLLDQAKRHEYLEEMPENLRFVASSPDRIPADDGSYDVLVSWSCFEHVSQPVAMATEMRRVIRDHGVLFLQLWPFYYSEHGSHLFDWYPSGFPHLVIPHDELRARVLEEDHKPLSEYIWNEYENLNKITVDDLGAALYEGGFTVSKVELISAATHLPPEVAHLPLSQLLVSGIKLLATPRPR